MLERMWRKGNPLALLVGMQAVATTLENSMEVPQEVKNKATLTLGNKQSNHEMGKRHEEKSHRGRHRHGQHAHEKMLHITCHQGNTNQNHNEIPPHTSENGEN